MCSRFSWLCHEDGSPDRRRGGLRSSRRSWRRRRGGGGGGRTRWTTRTTRRRRRRTTMSRLVWVRGVWTEELEFSSDNCALNFKLKSRASCPVDMNNEEEVGHKDKSFCGHEMNEKWNDFWESESNEETLLFSVFSASEVFLCFLITFAPIQLEIGNHQTFIDEK